MSYDQPPNACCRLYSALSRKSDMQRMLQMLLECHCLTLEQVVKCDRTEGFSHRQGSKAHLLQHLPPTQASLGPCWQHSEIAQ